MNPYNHLNVPLFRAFCKSTALLLLLTTIGFSSLFSEDVASQQQPLVAFLVRHAEKAADGSADPDLTVAGRLRAAELAVLLRDTDIKHVHSSKDPKTGIRIKRTGNTAAPIAEELGQKVKLYDPRDLPTLVTLLRQVGGRHLIVGHSNTTPKVVELLGGESGAPINDKREFDRLYIVNVGANGMVSTVMMRYGAPNF